MSATRHPAAGADAAAAADLSVDATSSALAVNRGGGRWAFALLALVFVLAAGLRVGLLLRPLAVLDELTLPDDAYYDAEIARNLALGHGPEYRGRAMNGFQPLNVLLLAAALRTQPALLASDSVEARDRIVKIGLGLSALFDLASLLLLARLFWRRHGPGAATFFATTCWAAHPLVLATCFNGLETSLAFTCLLAILLVFEKRLPPFTLSVGRSPESKGQDLPDALIAARTSSPRSRPQVSSDPSTLPLRGDAQGERGGWSVALGLVLGIGLLARIDLAFAGVPILAVLAYRARGSGWRRLARELAWITAGVLVVQAPWLAWSFAWTHRLFPISGPAVHAQASAILSVHGWGAGWLLVKAVGVVVDSATAAALLLLFGLIPATALFGRDAARAWRSAAGAIFREHALLLGFAGCLIAAYVTYVRAFWFFPRYLFPAEVLPLLLLASGLGLLMCRVRPILAASAAIALALALCGSNPRLRDLYRLPPTHQRGYRALGLWAAGRFPEGTRIGATQSGALSYYAPRLEVVNLDGVVNPEALGAIQARALLGYMRRERLQYFLGWRVNLVLLRHASKGFDPAALVPIEEVPGIRSWGNAWQLWRVAPGA